MKPRERGPSPRSGTACRGPRRPRPRRGGARSPPRGAAASAPAPLRPRGAGRGGWRVGGRASRRPRLAGELSRLGFREPEGEDEAESAGEERHERGRVRERHAGPQGEDVECQEGGAGAQHAAADVGGEALARSTQVRRVDPRQVVPPEAELPDREERAEEGPALEEEEVAPGRV